MSNTKMTGSHFQNVEILIFRNVKVLNVSNASSFWVWYDTMKYLTLFSVVAGLFFLLSLNLPQATHIPFILLLILLSYKVYCSNELLCHLPPVNNVCTRRVLCSDATAACCCFCLLKSRAEWEKKEKQKHKIINTNTKVQSMQINWLANKYHSLTFSFHPPTPINISRFKQKDKLCGGQFSLEIATGQICPKHYKNIQSVRLVEMLRLESSIR